MAKDRKVGMQNNFREKTEDRKIYCRYAKHDFDMSQASGAELLRDSSPCIWDTSGHWPARSGVASPRHSAACHLSGSPCM